MMNFTTKFFLLVVGIVSLIITSVTFINFISFLSHITLQNNSTEEHINSFCIKDSNAVSYTTRATVVDLSLLCIFIIQHSSLWPFQDFLSSAFGLPVLSRSFLNLFTSASLQLLMYCWKPIPGCVLWSININEHSKQLFFLGVHIICWILIYIMMITMDVTDLLGIKQVYYHTTGRPAPSALKSSQLRHLHKKIRHPSLLGFAFIFWIYPYMSLDRLMLAIVWSVYMILVWRPDLSDYKYIVEKQAEKRAVL